ncbi:unnamed protein product [Adineta steineri]|uniref:Uncharacterized protein n=1 Tax=Adineta steineri TaxID=433720 RepID=A0A818ND41_9BILA|nr:unnamed protein product [Adineta steineri]CAF1321359.1 unnamed protein product [Adineta steineri]CAF3603499.1 unnamed protein product [Adineta steineri]CAF3645304.1 unnamed protein product [Adineta steineri]
MTAFARPSLINDRYSVIAETSVYTYDDDLVNYGEFLQNHGRYMTKGGYVDSSRRIRSLYRQQGDLQTLKNDTSAENNLLPSLGKPSKSAPPATTNTKKLKPLHGDELSSFESISEYHKNKAKEHDRQMKQIKSEMIRAKQREREIKRTEGDIKKQQQHLRQSLRKLDVETTSKRYKTEKSLSKNLEEKDQIERERMKTREKQTKERADHAIDSLQAGKDKDRRNLLVCNDLAHQYRTKTNQLDVKHNQLDQIQSEYEQRIHRKELEENRLKKELAEIALALNLEAQKAKVDMNDFLTITDHERTQATKYDFGQQQKFDYKQNKANLQARSYELDKRRLSGDAATRRSILELRQREALGRISDTKNRLDSIQTKQRQLNANASNAEQDRRTSQLAAKMNEVDKRRSHLMNQYIRDKTEKSGKYGTDGTNTKIKIYPTDPETRQHEDRVRHLQKTLNKNKEIEFELRKSVKEAEFQRRKKEQDIQKLRNDLIRKKHEDTVKVRQAIAKSEQQERQIERNLTKENTKLDKLQTQKGNKYLRLTRQQEHIRESKSLLDSHEREHKRLVRAEAQSHSSQSLNDI